MKNFIQQPTPVPPQVEIPQEFPEIPQAILDRFPEAADWQRRLDDFWTRTNQAIQQAQDQTAKQVNSNVVFNVDSFLIYANGVPTAMFALDASGVRLGNVLVINTPGNKVYIGAGELANDNTPFYIDTLGNFSLGASLVWDPVADTLTITGIINATSGTIGGFTIGVDYIRDVANSFGLASTVTGGNDVRFFAGDTFANRGNAPFRVSENGAVFAISGNIGGFSLSSTGFVGGSIVELVPDHYTDPSLGLRGTIDADGGFASAISIGTEFFATGNGNALYTILLGSTFNAGAFTNVDGYGLFISHVTTGGTIRNGYGIFISSSIAGSTNKYGIYVEGAATRNVFEGTIESTRATGTAPFTVASTTVVGNLNVSQLLGATWTAPGTIGSGTPSSGAFTFAAAGNTTVSTSFLRLGAGTTGVASLNIPHGAAPTSPVNGDVWTTTAGIFVRINGATVGPLT